MILLTIGTTMPFDELVEEADRLAGTGLLGDDLVCQSGDSAYRVRHGEQFRWRPNLDGLFATSSLVITHGGATVIQLLMMKKQFVAFPNPRGAGDHQTGFLQRVATIANISWSSDVSDLERLIRERRAAGCAVVNGSIPRASDIVLAHLDR